MTMIYLFQCDNVLFFSGVTYLYECRYNCINGSSNKMKGICIILTHQTVSHKGENRHDVMKNVFL